MNTRTKTPTFRWKTLAGGAVIALLATSCAPGADGQQTAAPDVTAPASVPDSPAPVIGGGDQPTASDVSLRWRPADLNQAFEAGQVLVADLVNETDDLQQGRLVLVGSGLGGRLVERHLEDFQLAPRGTQEVRIPVAKVPVQSETSTSFVVAQAELTRPDGYVLRVRTEPMYFHFQGGFRSARFYRADDVHKLAPRLPANLDPMSVRGRMMETDGRWTEVVAGLAATADGTSPGLQGPTSVVLSPAGAPPVPGAVVTPNQVAVPGSDVVKQTGAIAVNTTLCATWRVQFVDSGFGEDVYPTSAWQDVPAAYANVWVQQNSNGSWVFNGKLSSSGCVTVPLSSLTTYTWYQGSTEMGWSGGPIMDNYLMINGTRNIKWVTMAFTTGPGNSTLNLKPSYNDDVVQMNAVTAATLLRESAVDNGMLNGTRYVTELRAAECGNELDPSCPYTSGGVVKVGVNKQQGTLMTNWKFMLAHELGHAVQYAAMGYHESSYAWAGAPQLCRCSHVDALYGNSHCIQSRGSIGGGQVEGFAQAYAARVFNIDSQPNATFVYYKPFFTPYNNPNYKMNPPMSFSAFSNNKFMSNYCGAANKGIELDWMQFYYQLTASATLNKTEMSYLFSIYRLACTNNVNTKCNGQTVTWEKLRATAQTYWGGNPIYTKFRDTGVNAGVNW